MSLPNTDLLQQPRKHRNCIAADVNEITYAEGRQLLSINWISGNEYAPRLSRCGQIRHQFANNGRLFRI